MLCVLNGPLCSNPFTNDPDSLSVTVASLGEMAVLNFLYQEDALQQLRLKEVGLDLKITKCLPVYFIPFFLLFHLTSSLMLSLPLALSVI